LSSRNALDQLKTVDDLNSAAEEVSGQFDNVTSSMDSALKEILYNAGWTAEDSVLFCISGLLPRIIRASLMAVMELHLHFQQLAIKHPTHWDEVGKEQVLHNVRGPLDRTVTSPLRGASLPYTYLRDQKSKSFMDVKLLGSLLMKWQGLALNRLPPGGGTTT
jgi:hypothetical protein